MIITINVDTSSPLSDQDRTVLNALAGNPLTVGAQLTFNEPAKAVKAPPKAAAKAAPAAAAAPVEDEKPAEDEDIVGGEPSLSDAIARATELVSSGKTAQVKAALGEVGAKRVSELTAKTLVPFLAALDAQG